MRVSLPSLREPRRLASEVLEQVSARMHSQPAASEPLQFYNQLPSRLQRFFERYPPSPYREYATGPRLTTDADANPFLANRHPVTNAWHKPKYSMRQQADLWKSAYRFGIQHLLPQLLHNRKFYEEKYAEKHPMRGSMMFKLTRRERKAPSRALEVTEAVQHLDEKIAARKGKRFTNFLKTKDRVGHV